MRSALKSLMPLVAVAVVAFAVGWLVKAGTAPPPIPPPPQLAGEVWMAAPDFPQPMRPSPTVHEQSHR